MFKKIINSIFCVAFGAMIGIPLLTTNLRKDKISEAENRILAPKAEIYTEEGVLNKNYTTDFETWINDNIGFRSQMVINNARIQYYIFHVLANNSDMYLGPNGELNYATPAILEDYQHANLYTEDYLKQFAASMQYVSDYVTRQGKQFYYYQCWDKHSIYPEYFPKTVIQSPGESKTDGLIRALEEYTDVNVISPKQDLIDAKDVYETYSVWGDSTHWTQRGAFIGYQKLMNTINANSEKEYKVLQESDYSITKTDQGTTLFGGIHRPDYLENFELKTVKAVLTNDKLTLYADEPSHSFYTNDQVDNDTTVLVIGDSYFNSFIIDDLAESFHEVIIIWGDYLADAKNIIDSYDPNIVIVEAAERVDRSGGVIAAATLTREALEGVNN